MDATIFDFLKSISLRHTDGRITLNTIKISRELGISQQSASRYLIILEREGYITRRRLRYGEEVTLTEKAFDEVKKQLNALEQIIKSSREVKVEGILFTGLGEGGYYISREGYVKKIKEYLHFVPFSGTLNLRISEEYMGVTQVINNFQGFEVEPFLQDGRKFGAIKILKAELRGNKVGIVLPDRTHYENVLEVISPENLREKYKLRDGDSIEVTVYR